MTLETATKKGLENIVVAEDPILDILNRTLPTTGGQRKYSNIQLLTEGGTRKIYTANWGPKEKTVVIKVDKVPSSPRAIRHVERGYNTQKELQVVSGLEAPDENNIVRLRDYFYSEELPSLDQNLSGTITIEDYFPGKTLKEIVEEKPLKALEFEQVFEDVLIAERYLINDEGLLHRDLSKNNILVKRNGRTHAKVTDLTNACDKGETKVQTLPTSGAMSILDPTTCSIFMGKESKYREESEIYANGMNMIYALTGIDPVEYNPDKGTAFNTATGESLLDSRGIVDPVKHGSAIESALWKLPKDAQRYQGMISKATSLHEEIRYHSIDDLIKDFNEAKKPTLWEKIKKHKFVTGVLTAGLLAIGAGAVGTVYNFVKNTDLEAKLEDREKVHVVSKWNGVDLEISNNLVDLGLVVYSDSKDGKTLWDNVYPEKEKFIRAIPGKTIWGYVQSKAVPRAKQEEWEATPSIMGKVYIEGYDGKEFTIYPNSFNEAVVISDMHGEYGSKMFNLDIPKDLKEGVYTLATELYAGDNVSDAHIINSEDKINFTRPGKLLARKRVPLVVGDPKDKAHLRTIGMAGYIQNFSMYRPDSTMGSINPNLNYEMSIVEEDTSWGYNEKVNSNTFSMGFRMPEGDDTTTRTLQVVVKDKNDNIVGYNFAPIERYHVGEQHWLRYSTPGQEWSERLPAYRKAIYGNKTEADSIRTVIKNERLEREKARADSLKGKYGSINGRIVKSDYLNGGTGK